MKNKTKNASIEGNIDVVMIRTVPNAPRGIPRKSINRRIQRSSLPVTRGKTRHVAIGMYEKITGTAVCKKAFS